MIYLLFEKMENLKVVFTGGGTGGHVYPNAAIYEALKKKYPKSSFLYIGTKKGAESRITQVLSPPVEFVEILSRGFPEKQKSFDTLVSLFFIFLGTVKSYFILKKFKPDIVIGSGGYVAAPVLAASYFLKLKVFLHEQNAVPGRLNRLFSRVATRIGVNFKSTLNFFPENKTVVTGYPLRESIRNQESGRIKKELGIPEKNKVIFIVGGSGGAKTINSAIIEIIPSLISIENLTVIFATGRGYSKKYMAFEDTIFRLDQAGINPEIDGKLIIREYFENISRIYSISDLVISRAGAGTIEELTALGIPSILIPKIDLPGDHQILNAKEIKRIGGAEILFEETVLESNERKIYIPERNLLSLIKKLVKNEKKLISMRENLIRMEKLNTCSLILEEIKSIISNNKDSEENEIRIYYLQSPEKEKTYELIFDSITAGNSWLCDIFLDDVTMDTIFQIRILPKTGNLVLKIVKGELKVNGQPVNRIIEIKEEDKIEIEDITLILKSYFEKVKKTGFERETASKIRRSSLGIFISRIGGFFREIVTAAVFGAGRAMDLFAVGFTISNLMRRIVAENALENAFLPIFSRIFYRTSRKKTWEASSSIINFTLILSLILTGLGILFSPQIIKTLFPSFAEKGMLADAVKMTRIMFPYLFLVTVSSVMTVYLKAFNRFGIAEASSIFFSAGTICGILIFNPVFGIFSLALGVLMGGLLQIMFLTPFTRRVLTRRTVGFFYKPVLALNSSINKKYYSQLYPISIDVVLAKIAEIVDQVIASSLSTGSLSFLYYAKTIFRLPFALISQSVNSVILKEFSDKIALFNQEKMKKLLLEGIRTNLFLLTPVSILMYILSKPIVSILLERFNFSESNVLNTAFALQFYAIGLVGWGIHSLTVRLFAARIDIKTSMVLNLFMLSGNIVLCLLLVRTSLKFAGLALATSISFIFFSIIRIAVLRYKLAKEDIVLELRDIFSAVMKTLVSSVLMIIVLEQAGFVLKSIHFNSPSIKNLTLLISLSFIGIAVYFSSSLLLKNTEILLFKEN